MEQNWILPHLGHSDLALFLLKNNVLKRDIFVEVSIYGGNTGWGNFTDIKKITQLVCSPDDKSKNKPTRNCSINVRIPLFYISQPHVVLLTRQRNYSKDISTNIITPYFFE